MAEFVAPKLGSKVKVTTKDDVKIGIVGYVGATSFAPGNWIGIILDDASGKNDGEVQGKRYFTCPENCGIFVRPNQVQLLEGEMESSTGSTAGSGRSTPISQSTESLDQIATPLKPKSGLKVPGTGIKTPGSGLKAPTSRLSAATANKGSSQNLAASGEVKGSNSNLSLSHPLTASESKGSVTNLAAPAASKSAITAPAPKPLGLVKPRASVSGTELSKPKEEGSFIEPLPAAVTQSPAPLSSDESVEKGKFADPQLQEKVKRLEAQLQDTTERLETLKIKRQEDKAKLKEAEKLKIQYDQLKEYKVRSQETHKELQQQLLAAKKEAKDVQEAFDAYKEEMAEVHETIELSTLDKEMAEERAESLQLEVDTLKEKNEELSSALEIMKKELEGGAGAKSDGVSSYQVKQLEQQNEKLKDALVKLRDISNNEKAENASLKKQNERLTQEVTHLKKDKETRIEEIEILNAEIIDLKDQLDAALGAEEMVEKMTEQNLTLEERVRNLEEEKADLEAINDMNEELQENARDVEIDLREQLDLAKSQVNQLEQSVQASQLQIADLQSMITRYRDLVHNLQEEVHRLSQTTSASPQAPAPMLRLDSVDMKSKITESKIQAKVIEMEMLQLELQFVSEQLQAMGKFLPESFFVHGGDNDWVQVSLLFPYMLQKVVMLGSQIKTKFGSSNFGEEDVVKQTGAESYSFSCYMQCYLTTLEHQFNKLKVVANDADHELNKAMPALLNELRAYCKPVSQYLDLLQKDQLYETVSVEPLVKALRYFKDYCDSNLGTYQFDCTAQLRDYSKVLLSLTECLGADLKRLGSMLQAGESSESSMINFLMSRLSELSQVAKRLKHRMPTSESRTQVTYSSQVAERIQKSLDTLTTLMDVIHSAATQASRALQLLPEADHIPAHQIHQFLVQASEIIEDGSSDLYASLRACIEKPYEVLKVMITELENGTLDSPLLKKERAVNGMEQRAEAFKRNVCEGDSTRAKLMAKEEIINELRMELRKKQEEVEEYKVRAGMADKKVLNAVKDKDDQILKLQRKIEEAQIQLKKKEKEFEQTMDTLQSDIDSLENEKASLQAKLTNLSKKQMYESLSKNSSGGISPAVAQGMVSSGLDSPHLLQQIKSLKATIIWLREENLRYKTSAMKEKLASLKSLSSSGQTAQILEGRSKQANSSKQEREELKQALALVHQNTCNFISTRKVSNVKVPADSQIGSELLQSHDQLNTLAANLRKLQHRTYAFIGSSPNTGVQAQMQSFPLPEYSKSLTTGPDCIIGRIEVPAKGEKELIPLKIKHEQLLELLKPLT